MSEIPFIQTGHVDPLGMSISCHGKTASEIKKACAELESVFINYLLKEMRATIPKSGSNLNGFSGDMYTSMLDMQLSEHIAEGGGIGLASVLSEQLLSDNRDTIPEVEKETTKK